jgi:putative protein kinase ArgK-like GTPase of G3E family
MIADCTPEELFTRLRGGDRAALGRAITLIESTRQVDRERARALLQACAATGARAFRIGITGIPGVGKSTLIDALGMALVEAGHRVAVLAVDPSSVHSGGSILGDKTRMERLSQHASAFIRPTATGGTLGGVARRTRETILLCEAAGYDRLLIETVGVGQSELDVDRMSDLNVLLMIAGAGDELQGIKRGEGIPGLKDHVEQLLQGAGSSGLLAARRSQQNLHWMHRSMVDGLRDRLEQDAPVRALRDALEQQVAAGTVSPFDAAEQVVALFRTDGAPRP